MTFSLHVDADAWRKHLDHTTKSFHKAGVRVVPVVKGNGYGFGRTVLAREAARMGMDTIAVGNVYELEQALADFPGTCVVLEPFVPSDYVALEVWRRALRLHADRVVVTIAGPDLHAADGAGATRARLEANTSMHRFGLNAQGLDLALRGTSHGVRVEGLSIHLPITEPQPRNTAVLEAPGQVGKASGWLREALAWATTWSALADEYGIPAHISVSHLTAHDAQALAAVPGISVDLRIGTSLWLGEPDALEVTGTVLAVHEAGMGHDHVGYTQVDSHAKRRVLIVSGGTSHGVALSAPTSPTTLRRRGVAVAHGLTEAMGKVRSPFRLGRHPLTFVEPPHMHVSMLWCEDRSVAVGDHLRCRVRLTTASFDVITGLD